MRSPSSPKLSLRLALVAAALGAAALIPMAADASKNTPRPQPLGEFRVTGYWIAPESVFTAVKLTPKGIPGRYREDFLYSATGVSMEGTGRTDDGRLVHWASGRGAWVDRAGEPTASSEWFRRPPFVRPGGCTWWRVQAGLPATNLKRPTFPQENGSWNNPPPGASAVFPKDFPAAPADGIVVPVCDRAAAAAQAPYPGGHDMTKREYPDSYGFGIGTPITEWKSLATDRSVIPRGSRVYIEALKDTPARGCFVAEDTGGAIIGKHIDVFVPFGYKGLPAKANLVLLPEGVPCPPPRTLAPGPLGDVNVSYLVPAAQRDLRAAARTTARGLGNRRLSEDFLYGPDGVVARGVGVAGRTTIVARGGGWWVNARGKKTTQRRDGTWTNGRPVWREGGWRTRKGHPTYRLANGRWAHGVGVRYVRYRDRFRVAQPGEFAAWRATGARGTTAPVGTVLALGGEGLERAQCLVVNRQARRLPVNTLQIVVPPGTDPATLPQVAPATVLDEASPCATRRRR